MASLSLSMATGRSEAGDASVMLDRYYGHGMGVISWAGRPSLLLSTVRRVWERPSYYYLLQLLLQLLPTQQQRFICTMLKVDLMSQRPRGVFIDIEIFYISIG